MTTTPAPTPDTAAEPLLSRKTKPVTANLARLSVDDVELLIVALRARAQDLRGGAERIALPPAGVANTWLAEAQRRGRDDMLDEADQLDDLAAVLGFHHRADCDAEMGYPCWCAATEPVCQCSR